MADLHGVRCGNPAHEDHGTVYGTCLDLKTLDELRAADGHLELVTSTDGGNTWTRAEP